MSQRCQREGSSAGGTGVGSVRGRDIGVRLMEVLTRLRDPAGEETQ